MRRILPILACLYACAAGAQTASFFADEEAAAPRTFYGGIAAGANCSQVDGDGYSGYNKVGLNAGPMVYARLSPLFGASMELLYTQKGSRYRGFSENSYGVPYQDQYDLKLSYIEVPVLLHVYAMPRLHVGAGVSYARLIRSSEEAFTVAPVNLYPDSYTFRKDDFSAVGDGLYELYRGLFVNLRYSYSLKTIRDAERIPPGYGNGRFSRQLNNLFSLRLVLLLK